MAQDHPRAPSRGRPGRVAILLFDRLTALDAVGPYEVLAREIGGDDLSQMLQLGIEYDPQPPFDSGSEAKAPAHISQLFRDNSRFVLEG